MLYLQGPYFTHITTGAVGFQTKQRRIDPLPTDHHSEFTHCAWRGRSIHVVDLLFVKDYRMLACRF